VPYRSGVKVSTWAARLREAIAWLSGGTCRMASL
jgi:hypothetical protein